MDVFEMKFAKVFPLLIAKAERKGRTADEVYEVTCWLTGYTKEDLKELLNGDSTYGEFLDKAPRMNPDRFEVTTLVAGRRAECRLHRPQQAVRGLDERGARPNQRHQPVHPAQERDRLLLLLR